MILQTKHKTREYIIVCDTYKGAASEYYGSEKSAVAFWYDITSERTRKVRDLFPKLASRVEKNEWDSGITLYPVHSKRGFSGNMDNTHTYHFRASDQNEKKPFFKSCLESNWNRVIDNETAQTIEWSVAWAARESHSGHSQSPDPSKYNLRRRAVQTLHWNRLEFNEQGFGPFGPRYTSPNPDYTGLPFNTIFLKVVETYL